MYSLFKVENTKLGIGGLKLRKSDEIDFYNLVYVPSMVENTKLSLGDLKWVITVFS